MMTLCVVMWMQDCLTGYMPNSSPLGVYYADQFCQHSIVGYVNQSQVVLPHAIHLYLFQTNLIWMIYLSYFSRSVIPLWSGLPISTKMALLVKVSFNYLSVLYHHTSRNEKRFCLNVVIVVTRLASISHLLIKYIPCWLITLGNRLVVGCMA